jgi:hypothetical protein
VSPSLLLQSARRLLRPLVRLMMRNGVTFPVLSDTLRQLFVEVAAQEMLTGPGARTDSRISLLSGVHRKEIKRLRELPADAEAAPEVVTVVSLLVSRWLGSPGYTDAEGRPLALPRSSRAGEACFDSLVESVTSDVRPRAVLDDLLSHGVVTMDASERLVLNAEAFLPRPGGEAQMFYFARNLHDHIEAAAANVSAPGAPPFLDRSVHFDGLTAAQARELQDLARAAAMRALLEVNRRAVEMTEGGAAPGDAETLRLNFGVYVLGAADPPGAGRA